MFIILGECKKNYRRKQQIRTLNVILAKENRILYLNGYRNVLLPVKEKKRTRRKMMQLMMKTQ